MRAEIGGIEAYTASLKGAAIVSSSQQVQNYFTFAKTGSANTFYGNQTFLGTVDMATASIANASFVESATYFDIDTLGGKKLRLNKSGNQLIMGTAAPVLVGSVTEDGTSNPLQVNGNQSITGGDLVFRTAGKGIDFSATSNSSGTMTSELLNDYEEGTWTPTIALGSGGTGATYNTQYGVYTKIGNVVHFGLRIILSNKGTSTGGASIGGLPFTSANTNGNYGAVSLGFADAVSSFDKTLTFIIDPNATTIGLRYCNGTNYVDLNDTNFTNTSNIIVSGTYRTA
jgi:hypothetical protein